MRKPLRIVCASKTILRERTYKFTDQFGTDDERDEEFLYRRFDTWFSTYRKHARNRLSTIMRKLG